MKLKFPLELIPTDNPHIFKLPHSLDEIAEAIRDEKAARIEKIQRQIAQDYNRS